LRIQTTFILLNRSSILFTVELKYSHLSDIKIKKLPANKQNSVVYLYLRTLSKKN